MSNEENSACFMSDEPEDFGGRGDEVPFYPPIGSPEWEVRLRTASADLRQAEKDIFAHCEKINQAVLQMFRELGQ